MPKQIIIPAVFIYYFVSDDSYFLNGINESLPDRSNNVSLLYYGNIYPVFSPAPDDVVIISVRDVHKRYRLSGMAQLANCRVLLLLKCSVAVTTPQDGAFPWILPWRTDVGTLKSHIEKAHASPFRRQLISERDRLIFNYLAEELSIPHLAFRVEKDKKYIYLLKRNRIIRLGLEGNSATTILACRDIIRLSLIY